MTKPMATVRFEAGRLLCGHVRDYLAVSKLEGKDINWHEGSGWISRTFTIRGPQADVLPVYGELVRWAETLDEQEGK
jgi:diadenosine tetraphosphatase ApaH/serine/threonine PP2A family protein phosphatase